LHCAPPAGAGEQTELCAGRNVPPETDRNDLNDRISLSTPDRGSGEADDVGRSRCSRRAAGTRILVEEGPGSVGCGNREAARTGRRGRTDARQKLRGLMHASAKARSARPLRQGHREPRRARPPAPLKLVERPQRWPNPEDLEAHSPEVGTTQSARS